MESLELIARKVEELSPWFHNIHLPCGIQTSPGHFLGDFPSYKWNSLSKHLPEDLSNYEVLDIGCNAGFYALEFAKRNAQVTAIDIDPHYLKQAEWVTGQFNLQDRIKYFQLQVYDLARINKKFDIVNFMGVFYHLRYPLLALDIISLKVKGLLIFQSLSLSVEEEYEAAPEDIAINNREIMSQPGWPSMAFIENRLSGDPTNWWVPNKAAIKAMCRTCGLQFINSPDHEIYLFEPDQSLIATAASWNKSEYLSAIGEDWTKELSKKTGTNY